ncbi:peptidylprolyl isomerase [Balneola sp. MJW-20]|uniref:peptidylprolyl isomerase n=1 Tax=Gracilimonas aurantiaca TaxID=3234185 RepID=UPI00390B013B
MLIVFSMLLGGCSMDPGKDALQNEYPALYEAVFVRDAAAIMEFTRHENMMVRDQAWRAMVSTPVDSMEQFMNAVHESGNEIAWLALSTKELEGEQLRTLETWWTAEALNRAGISRVIGKQGDQQSMEFLLSNRNIFLNSEAEYHSALAIGRLNLNYEVDQDTELWLAERAIENADNETGPAYLFGYYRSSRTISNQQAAEMLWESRNNGSSMFRQYILNIMLRDDKENRLGDLMVDGITNKNVQEVVHISLGTMDMEWGKVPEGLYEALLKYDNPVLDQLTLSIIAAKDDRPDTFDESIEELIIQDENRDVSARLYGISALKDPAEYTGQAEKWASKDEYLLSTLFGILRRVQQPDEYFSSLRRIYESSNDRAAFFVISSLPGWWTPLSENDKAEVGYSEMRELVFKVLNRGSRSMTFTLGALLQDERLLRDQDFDRLIESLSTFSLPADVEVYQALSGLLYLRFEDRAAPLIDSLAAYGNTALNNTFKNDGWDIESGAINPVKFRNPDWERLTELHNKPEWVLETTKGVIRIKLDVLNAPATISGMDSLSAAGAYNGVAFHRVVPNFVIQGGDIETGNGFGGPDYVVPTESSEKEYRRGVVGIASAGTDTEGSQYFIMHKWDPRLNGAYSVIGEVTEGMEVVDRIVVGDRVLSSIMGSQ